MKFTLLPATLITCAYVDAEPMALTCSDAVTKVKDGGSYLVV